MTLIVEDGTGVAAANSYATVAELEAYAEYRLDISGYSEALKEGALVLSSIDWVDGAHSIRSCPLTTAQALKFPTVDDELPQDIKNATMRAALLHLQGLLFVDLASINASGEVESESKTLGPLSKSVSYQKGTSARYSRVIPADLRALMRPYTGGGLGTTARA